MEAVERLRPGIELMRSRRDVTSARRLASLALVGAVFGPPDAGEVAFALRLADRLGPDMLVLADRGFDADAFVRQFAATGAAFLLRIRTSRRPPVPAQLPDGSFLSVLAGVKVRVIDADVIATLADGRRLHGRYR